MSAAPALAARPRRPQGAHRGRLDADLVVWDPDAEFVVDPRAAAASPQAHAVRGPTAARRGSHDVPARHAACADGDRLVARPGGTPAYDPTDRFTTSSTSPPSASAARSSRRTTSSSRRRKISCSATAPVWREASTPSAASGWTAGRRAGAAIATARRARLVHRPARRCPAIVRGVVVDTTFFTGNLPESCAIDALRHRGPRRRRRRSDAARRGGKLLPRTHAQRATRTIRFAIDGRPPATHLRLHIYPGRRRRAAARPRRRARRTGLDLRHARATSISPRPSTAARRRVQRHVLRFAAQPDHARRRGVNMGDGWETKRRRGPGHDWTIVRLGAAGADPRVESTRGTSRATRRAPAASMACVSADVHVQRGLGRSATVARAAAADAAAAAHASDVRGRSCGDRRRHHVRLNIFPDGGVARLRLFGTPE